MYVQNVNRRNSESYQNRVLLLVLAALVWPLVVYAQTSLPSPEKYIEIGREFLRALYPELSGKGYVVTLETALPFDDSSRAAKYFMLDVGAGPKFVVLECCIGGYIGGILPTPQLPWPPELGPAPNAPTPGAQPSENRPRYWDAQGQVHPKQYLSTGFSFDDKNRLAGFTAEGPAIGDPHPRSEFVGLASAYPNMGDQEIGAALKRSGAKYGPGDKEQFVKALPLTKLEPFLGKLELASVNFVRLGEDRAERGSLPCWMVEVLATREDGTKSKYKLTFDTFKGDLTTLGIVPPTTSAKERTR